MTGLARDRVKGREEEPKTQVQNRYLGHPATGIASPIRRSAFPEKPKSTVGSDWATKP